MTPMYMYMSHLQGQAKDARYARQLAEAVGSRLPDDSGSRRKKDSANPGNTLCFSAVK